MVFSVGTNPVTMPDHQEITSFLVLEGILIRGTPNEAKISVIRVMTHKKVVVQNIVCMISPVAWGMGPGWSDTR